MKLVKHLLTVSLAAIACAGLCQCGAAGNIYRKATAKTREKERQAALDAHTKAVKDRFDRQVGVDVVAEIVSVDTDCQFVLLRNLRVPNLNPNVTCEVKTGSGARLQTCTSQKAGYIVADIVSGSPAKGELVVVSKTQEKAAVSPSAKYLPLGMTEEEYWKQQGNVSPETQLQGPEGNPTVPDLPDHVRNAVPNQAPAPQPMPEVAPEPMPPPPTLPTTPAAAEEEMTPVPSVKLPEE